MYLSMLFICIAQKACILTICAMVYKVTTTMTPHLKLFWSVSFSKMISSFRLSSRRR